MTPKLGDLSVKSGVAMDIPIGKLNVDTTYQRAINQRFARLIAENLDPDDFGRLIVYQREDGTFWIVDGQHRWYAVKYVLGWSDSQMVPCDVYSSSGAAEEAKRWLAQNSPGKVHVARAVESFFARLVQGDVSACAIRDIVSSCGLEVSRHSRDGCVAATTACEKVYRGEVVRGKRGIYPWALKATLRTLVSAWDDKRQSLNSQLILTIGTLYCACDKIDEGRLIRALSEYPGGPNGLIADARQFARLQALPGGTRVAMIDAIISHYNKRLRSASTKLPRWRDVK